MISSTDIIIWASGEFLTKKFPPEGFGTDEELLSFISDHVTQPYEDDLPEVVYDHIKNLWASVSKLLERANLSARAE